MIEIHPNTISHSLAKYFITVDYVFCWCNIAWSLKMQIQIQTPAWFLVILIVMYTLQLAVSKLAGQRFSVTPYISTRATPSGTPKTISTSVSPRRYSASGTTSPTKMQYEGRTTMSSWYSSSQQSSAGNSPPRGPPIPGLWPITLVKSNDFVLFLHCFILLSLYLSYTTCFFKAVPLKLMERRSSVKQGESHYCCLGSFF